MKHFASKAKYAKSNIPKRLEGNISVILPLYIHLCFALIISFALTAVYAMTRPVYKPITLRRIVTTFPHMNKIKFVDVELWTPPGTSVNLAIDQQVLVIVIPPKEEAQSQGSELMKQTFQEPIIRTRGRVVGVHPINIRIERNSLDFMHAKKISQVTIMVNTTYKVKYYSNYMSRRSGKE